ncbi:uncharacterized protein V6R79_025432 [Siganus canaliculatus]
MSEVFHPPERAYGLIPTEEVHTPKPPRYMSKHRPAVILEEKASKDAMRTMGPAKVELPSPDKYLKKHSKEPKLSEETDCPKEFCRSCTARKPPVPARTDHPPMGIQTKRNFIKTVTTTPAKPWATSMDAIKGHKQLLENSGLAPKYIKKKDYGEVPQYLLQRAEEQRRAQEEHDKLVREQREKGCLKQLSEEHRQTVLQDLRKNWEELQREYQGLPLITDTFSQRSHKQRLEVTLSALETDIDRIERFKTIYVSDM